MTLEKKDAEAILQFNNQGEVIPQEELQHIFERGFSTKGDGRGTGLALVRDIIETYNGTIRVESDLGVGTSFIITLTDHT